MLYLLSYSAVGFYTSKKSNFCQAPNEYFFGMKTAIRKTQEVANMIFRKGKNCILVVGNALLEKSFLAFQRGFDFVVKLPKKVDSCSRFDFVHRCLKMPNLFAALFVRNDEREHFVFAVF